MQDDTLPTHDYFIFVPARREDKSTSEECLSGMSTWQQDAWGYAQGLYRSWTRIVLAETFDVYARF